MSKALGRSMPARLALDLLDAGEPVAIPILGMGVIENDGPDDDERVAAAYDDLAGDDDPATMVCQFYFDQVEEHPWMANPLAPVLDLFGKPTDALQDKVRAVARVLRTQSIRGCEEWAEADLLGRVSTNMSHLAARRKGRPGYSITLADSAVSTLVTDPEYVMAMGSLTDMWAGSGMRAIGMAVTIRALGEDPEQITWALMEADPILRMIIAINCRAFDMGEKIIIADGTKYKQALLAADAAGEVPARFPFVDQWALDLVPDEVRSMIRDRK